MLRLEAEQDSPFLPLRMRLHTLEPSTLEPSKKAISPWLEMGAYEALWAAPSSTAKRVADELRASPGSVPSDLILPNVAQTFAKKAQAILTKGKVERFGVRIHGAGDYPSRLCAAGHPIGLLYFQGWWDLVETRSVAVVGSRRATAVGKRRAARIARGLVADRFTVVSGLAAGIDTVAHRAAIEAGGWTIGVIGTPLYECYPRENRELQALVARDHLLISEVPIVRYSNQTYLQNRFFFPQRNVTMSALTEATVIIEASDTSGTLVQARAALKQGRKLFILESCFQRPGLKWPQKFLQKGATRVRDYDDIREHLEQAPANS